MTLDSLSYAAPARIRALLCPLGRIKHSRFSSFVERLQTANVVRLGDITPDNRPNRTIFSPQGFPSGQVVYDLSTSLDREHEYLETFEYHRRTFLVIGLADHEETNDLETLSKQVEELKFLYPNALYHVCVIFDSPLDPSSPEPTSQDAETEYPAFMRVPSERDAKLTSMRTLMCDITSAVLSELGSLAKSLQGLPTLESPSITDQSLHGNPRDNRKSMPVGGIVDGTSNRNSAIINKRMTMTGFGSGSVSERARNKGKGRVQVAVAQLYLLAGRVPDALKEFVESAEVARTNTDHLWHAKALEGIGICLVILLHLKANFQIPTIPYPTVESTKSSKSSPVSSKPSTPVPTVTINGLEGDATAQQVFELLPDIHNNVLNLYSRSANFPGEAAPQICYSETVLRFCRLLTSVHLSNGLNEDALSHIVIGTPLTEQKIKKNNPSRIDISNGVMRAYPQPVETMTVLEITKVFSGIASTLGAIGLHRRKAFVTRELLKILIPGLIQARVVGAAEVGVHPAAGLSALSGNSHGGGGSPLDLGDSDVESGIMELLEDLCSSYGIVPSPKEKARRRKEEQNRPTSWEPGKLETAPVTKEVIAEQEIRGFGWPALKIHVLRNCTALCEALPDFQGVLTFTTLLLRTADMALNREEQMRLSTTISRTVGAARKLGLVDVEAEYWDQFLLRDVELMEHPTWRPPIPHAKNELLQVSSQNTAATAQAKSSKNPFIYNPFLKKTTTTTTEQLLVKDEAAEFRVTLQNPFEFELEVESVDLDAGGVEFETQKVGVVIPPFRTYQVSMYATPKNCGDIRIAGCKVKVYGCRERAFPIFTEGLDPRERDTKTKRFGLAAAVPKVERPLSTISATGRSSLRPPPILHPIPKTLGLTVIDSQPLLVVKSTSLSQSAIMVLEGERKVFDLTLTNLTSTEVDLLIFSFLDSTTGRIQQALAEKGNSPSEMYELELMLAKKRGMVWKRPEGHVDDVAERKVFVPANGSATFQIEVLGKPGLTHGTVQADYSHLGRPRSEVDSRFYTRQVEYPITVTVNASIELARVDFVPFSTDLNVSAASTSNTSSTKGIGLAGQFRELFSNIGIQNDPGEYCLMLLDLRNAWPHPLEVKLAIKDPSDTDDSEEAWKKAFHAEDILQAGHTSRVILPVRRIFLENPTESIPSISAHQRQFVVSTQKISVETERQSREAFWYREELLKCLRGTWEELGTDRKGDIELRGIRLSPRMVETIRVEDIGIELAVEEEEKTQRLAKSKFLVETDRFMTLITTITNRTTRNVRPVLRLLPALRNQPISTGMDLNRRLAVNGLLQQGLKPLVPGEVRQVKTGFVTLAKGEYEISASVEEVIPPRRAWDDAAKAKEAEKKGLPADILSDGRASRKCWVCREICLIVAKDCV